MSRGRRQPVVTAGECDDPDGEPDEPSQDEDGYLVHGVGIAWLSGDPNKASAPGFC